MAGGLFITHATETDPEDASFNGPLSVPQHRFSLRGLCEAKCKCPAMKAVVHTLGEVVSLIRRKGNEAALNILTRALPDELESC